MFCKNCGKEVADDAFVCESCGATLKKETFGKKLSSLVSNSNGATVLCFVMAFASLFFLVLSSVSNLMGLSYFGVHPSDYEELSFAIDRMYGLIGLFDTLFVSLMSTIGVVLGIISLILNRKEKDKRFLSVVSFIFSILVWLFVLTIIIICSVYAGKILPILRS